MPVVDKPPELLAMRDARANAYLESRSQPRPARPLLILAAVVQTRVEGPYNNGSGYKLVPTPGRLHFVNVAARYAQL